MSAVLFITVPELVIEWGTIQKRGLQMICSEKAYDHYIRICVLRVVLTHVHPAVKCA